MNPINPEDYGDEIHFDVEDLQLMAQRRHPSQDYIRRLMGADSMSDSYAMPQRYMRALDEVTLVYTKGKGKYGRGYAEASLKIRQEDPWFWSHFIGDPVMPGSQGQDGFAQLGCLWGVYSRKIWGRARALGGSFEFIGQILPTSDRIFYRADIIRFLKKKRIVIFDGYLSVDTPDNIIYKFGETRAGFYSCDELGIPPDPKTYYHPDWDQIRRETQVWINNAQNHYKDDN